MKVISVMGCGWLGLPLAKVLLGQGHTVKGSTTSNGKLELLEEYGIDPYIVRLSESKVEGNVNAFLEGSEIVVLNIPPNMRRNPEARLSKKIETLIPFLEKAEIQKVLFISSTSVFADSQGDVTESTLPIPDNAAGKELLLSEQLLINNPFFKTTVLRLGGLLGPYRHPVRYLAGKKDLPNGDAPVNLIHQDDAVALQVQIIQQEAWGRVFHGVAPGHPEKSLYYKEKALEMGLQPPHFLKGTAQTHKRVSASKTGETLGYAFLQPIF